MSDLTDLSPTSQPTPDPETYEAVVSENAIAGQPVYVVIPEFDPNLNHGPCPWIPIVTSTGIFYPHKGDRAVVVEPAAGEPWIASWTPTAIEPDIANTPTAHAASHAPDGSDPIPTATATAITGTNAEGSSASFARADHDHAFAVEPWHLVGGAGEPAFLNWWTNYGSYAVASFYKDPAGRVYLRGLVRSGSLPGVVFILPPGYRPASTELFVGIAGTGEGRIDIESNGNVAVYTGSNSYVSLSGISFRAA